MFLSGWLFVSTLFALYAPAVDEAKSSLTGGQTSGCSRYTGRFSLCNVWKEWKWTLSWITVLISKWERIRVAGMEICKLHAFWYDQLISKDSQTLVIASHRAQHTLSQTTHYQLSVFCWCASFLSKIWDRLFGKKSSLENDCDIFK